MAKLEQALACTRAGSFEEALQIYAAIAAEEGQLDVEALGHRAWLYRSLGRFEEALDDYRAILRLNPSALNSKGWHYDTMLLMGRPGDALKGALEILSEDPQNTVAGPLVAKAQFALLGKSQDSIPFTRWAPRNPIIQTLESNTTSFPTSVGQDIGRMLYFIVRCIQPSIVVETGTFIGYSTLCIAQALEENGFGHVHSYDQFNAMPDYVSPVAGPITDGLEIAQTHINLSGLGHRITLHRGDSSAQIQRTFESKNDKIDFAFIDADHTVPGCFKDWNIVAKHLRMGGVVALHDTIPDNCHWLGPSQLLHRLGSDTKNFQSINLPSPDGFGIALIQKISDGQSPHHPGMLAVLTDYVFMKTRYMRQNYKK